LITSLVGLLKRFPYFLSLALGLRVFARGLKGLPSTKLLHLTARSHIKYGVLRKGNPRERQEGKKKCRNKENIWGRSERPFTFWRGGRASFL
jgi:hypothetical protein